MLFPSETTAGYLQSPAMEIKAETESAFFIGAGAEAESAVFTDTKAEAESAARQTTVKSMIEKQVSIQVRNLIIDLR
jgi:hypothetical protein